MTNSSQPTSSPSQSSGQHARSNDQTFHLQEYSALREEIIHHVTVNENIEREALIASVAVYAWVLTQTTTPWVFRIFVLFLPFILNYVGWRRGRTHGTRIHELGLYISSLEEQYGKEIEVSLPEDNTKVRVKGWEQYLASLPKKQRSRLGMNYDMRWKIYCIATLILPIVIAIYVVNR